MTQLETFALGLIMASTMDPEREDDAEETPEAFPVAPAGAARVPARSSTEIPPGPSDGALAVAVTARSSGCCAPRDGPMRTRTTAATRTATATPWTRSTSGTPWSGRHAALVARFQGTRTYAGPWSGTRRAP